ncbi:MAG: hypothetical protein HQK50_10050 [Oligoflexia bacterium]|nr:hypothetical protein [Oligoflexia bacterium]
MVLLKRMVITPNQNKSRKTETVEFNYSRPYYSKELRQFFGFEEIMAINYGDESQKGKITFTSHHSGHPDQGGVALAGKIREEKIYSFDQIKEIDPTYYSTYQAEFASSLKMNVDEVFSHSLIDYAKKRPTLDYEKLFSLAIPLEKKTFTFSSSPILPSSGAYLVCETSSRTDRSSKDLSHYQLLERKCNSYGFPQEEKESFSSGLVGFQWSGASERAVFLPETVSKTTSYLYAEGLYSSHIYNRRQRIEVTIDNKRQQQQNYQYNDKGQMIVKAQFLDNSRYKTEKFQYDSFGNMIEMTTPMGGKHSQTFDAFGTRLLTQKNPLGHQEQSFYKCAEVNWPKQLTSAGYECQQHLNKIAFKGSNGVWSYYAYDELGRLVASFTASTPSELTTYQYLRATEGTWNRILSTTHLPDHSPYQKASFYDLKGNLVAEVTTATEGRSKVRNYTITNRNDLPVEQFMPYFLTKSVKDSFTSSTIALPEEGTKSTLFSYDALGRKKSEIHPSKKRIYYQYSAGTIAEKEQLTSALTGQESMVTREKTVDFSNKVTSATNELGHSTIFKRNALGQLTSLVDPSGQISKYNYNGLGLIITLVSPTAGMNAYQ